MIKHSNISGWFSNYGLCISDKIFGGLIESNAKFVNQLA